MKYYLAHPFDSRKEMRQWELYCECHYDIEITNPFYDITRADIDPIDNGTASRYEHLDPEEVVSRDLNAITNSDAVIAYVSGDVSIGTSMEIVYAYCAGIPVYVICTNGHQNHPWLSFHAEMIFTSKDEFEFWLDDH